MKETVLVTGGTGYVASWCIVALLQQGYHVRTTVRSLAKESELRSAIASVVEPGDDLTLHVADLTTDTGWDAVMHGCDYVLHVASPLGKEPSIDAHLMTITARDGTIRVLRAAVAAGVKRVVMTSAATAATPPMNSSYHSISDEAVWFDAKERGVDAYRVSKRLAERAAWEYMNHSGGATSFATILPGAVFGPVLSTDNLGSVQIIARMVDGKVPANPRLGLEVIDVRDLAMVHIAAMTAPNAAGQRFLAVGDFLWMGDIARILRAELGDVASKVSTRTMPDVVLRFFALFDRKLRWMVPRLGREHRHKQSKAQQLLNWHQRSIAETLADCARSLQQLRGTNAST